MKTNKSTKRTWLSSILAVVMCVAMLVGTTFAWFTDTATTNVSEIKAGNLDVSLEVKEDGDWVSAEGKVINFVAKDGKENILWEPGCTYKLPELRVVNNGNLALKYIVKITGIEGSAKLNEVIEWTYDNKEVGYLNKKGDSSIINISGHMKETAGNEYQGLSIQGVAITAIATQAAYEYDSDDNQYDMNATFPYAKLVGGTHTVNGTYVAADEGGKKSVTALLVNGTNEATDVTITGGYFDGGNNGSSNNALWAYGKDANVTIKGGYFTVGTTYSGGGNTCIYASGGAKITIEGGTFITEACLKNGIYFVLNCADKSGSQITVKGGKFYKFNPANAGTKGSDSYVGENEIIVADGYTVKQSGDWYYVIPEGTEFVSDNNLDNALTKVTKNTFVTVTENTTVSKGVTTEKNTTLNVDFGGNVVKATEGVGSGNKTNGMQLFDGANVTLSNGTYSLEPKKVHYLIQNYSNLTIDNMVLSTKGYDDLGTNPTNTDMAVLSSNCGDVVITGNTQITAKTGTIALDIMHWENESYNEKGSHVTFDESFTGVCDGKIEVYCYRKGNIVKPVDDNGATLIIKGGTFKNTGLPFSEFKKFVPNGYTATENNGVYTVKAN